MVMVPREAAAPGCPVRTPMIVTMASCSLECSLISCQAAAVGVQVCAAACLGVSVGNSLLAETQRGSISPMRGRAPEDVKCMAGEPSLNETSIVHAAAAFDSSCQMKVGAVISG